MTEPDAALRRTPRTASRSTPRRTTPARGAVPLIVLLALLLALAGCGGAEETGEAGSDPTSEETASQDQSPSPDQGSSPEQSSAPGGTTTRLRLAGGDRGRCMAPNVRVLRAQDVAFEGTVTDVSAGRVTLEVSRWYVGEQTDVAVVQAPAPGMVELGFGTDLVEGKDYLLSATDGEITLCGFSGPASPRLADLYAEAYLR